MKTYNTSTPLISIHIPKCGGTSLRNTLKEWYGDNLFFHYFNEKIGKMPQKHKLEKWYSKRYKKNLCVHGHFNRKRGFGVNDYYPGVNQAITFLRDPLEIALSLFHYNIRREKEGFNYRDGKKMEVENDIDKFLERANSSIRLFLPEDLTIDNMDDFFSNYFIHVGVMEYYQQSIDILAEKLNKPKVIVPHENITKRNQTPSQSSIRKFKNRCQFEYILYEKVLKANSFI